MAEFRILSLDGGGAWALIQVRALIDLFSVKGDGSDVTGHEVLRRFDLIAGNSGGTLTLGGLIMDWPLSQLLSLFRDETVRKKIFVTASIIRDPISHLTQFAGIGPKYDTDAKLVGLRSILGARGDQLVPQLPNGIGPGYGGRAPQLRFCGFNYDTNREAFFRSDAASLAGSRAPALPISLAQAIHASTNAPINYFDAPAKGPALTRWWDGAVGGYNNPVLAAAIEALANKQRYNTDLSSIKALSLGTANVALPLSQGAHDEDPDLVAHRDNSTILNDVKKIASSILDDPPDAATFHAHVMIGCPLPGLADPLPVGTRVLRLNPLIQPVPGVGQPRDFPPGMDREAFVAIRDLSMDAVEQPQVDAIDNFCSLWLADKIPNQPVRANSATLAPEVGLGRYMPIKSIAQQWLQP